jgi:serine/threonine-protein kinase
VAQLDSYLKRMFSEYELSYLDDFYDMYSFVPNDDLRKILAAFHTNLNNWITVINADIRTTYDEDDKLVYSGGYFHAQDSRDYLSLIAKIDSLRSKLKSSEYAFRYSKDEYDDFVRRTRRFVVKSGGSTIPEGFEPVEIEDLNPVFELVSGVAISNENKTIYASMKLVGEGSYAKVFSYMDPTYNIPIILKRALASLDNKELKRFEQEFEILKSLHSPYIVEAYSYSKNTNEYTMECMDETLYDYILRNNASLSLKERKGIIAQICKGLEYIHSKNILHRDISLVNIFVKHYDDVNVIKLGDFGLVKNPENTLTSLQTEIKGSLNDSDLVNVGFANYEIRHETYALTRLCYFVLTGRTNISKQKDGAIKDFWRKGTNTDINERYNSVEELYVAINQITESNM